MAAKSGGKTLFCKKLPVAFADTLWVKKFCRNRSIALCLGDKRALGFRQKFKMDAKSGGKMIFGKSR